MRIGASRPGLSKEDLADQAEGTRHGGNAAARLLATEIDLDA
jgi:hypothetical protein